MSQIPGSQPAAGLQHRHFLSIVRLRKLVCLTAGSIAISSVVGKREHWRLTGLGAGNASSLLGSMCVDVQIHVAHSSAWYCKRYIEA